MSFRARWMAGTSRQRKPWTMGFKRFKNGYTQVWFERNKDPFFKVSHKLRKWALMYQWDLYAIDFALKVCFFFFFSFLRTLHATFLLPQVIGKMKKIPRAECTFPTNLLKTKLYISWTSVRNATKYIAPHIYLRKIMISNFLPWAKSTALSQLYI